MCQSIWYNLIKGKESTLKGSVDTQNCPESIMDIIIKFLSSRWLESMLESSHLVLGQGKRHFECWTSQSRLSRFSKWAKLTWPPFSNAITDFTIVFLSSSWSKNIYGTSNLGSGSRSYAPKKMLRCRDFRSKLELRPAPEPELPAQAWTSSPHSSQNFRPEPELLANLIKRSVRIWPFGFRSELFQTRGKLEK
jgi:hypothetical protein